LDLGSGRHPDRFNHTAQIREHFVIREAKHRTSLGYHPRIPTLIIALARFEIVSLSIQFDHQTSGMAHEIRNIAAHRHLTAETQPVNMVRFQIPPQQRFCTCHLLAQGLRAVALQLADVCVRHLW
jgi:hypothetical protein